MTEIIEELLANPWPWLIIVGIVAATIYTLVIDPHRRKKRLQQQADTMPSPCIVCKEIIPPMHYIEYVWHEGYAIVAAKEYSVSGMVCTACGLQLVENGKRAILRTFWMSLKGPLCLIFTFGNSRQVKKQILDKDHEWKLNRKDEVV